MTKRNGLSLIALVLASTLSLLAGDKPAAAVKTVEAKKVCMINERVFEKDQIPVVVEGKTYYGCCEMCKTALAQNADKRQGTDPVTGKKVDKATAVIAANADGEVFYFESQDTLNYYNAREAKKKN